MPRGPRGRFPFLILGMLWGMMLVCGQGAQLHMAPAAAAPFAPTTLPAGPPPGPMPGPPGAPGAPPVPQSDPINLSHAEFHGTRDVTTNGDGFRDATAPSPRGPAEVRVLCLGDSQTFGAALSPSEPWPRRLEERLAAASGARVTVINAGLPGFDARRGAELLEQVVDRYDPQIVVADFGYNDTHVPAPEGRWHADSGARMAAMAALMARRGGHFVFVAEAIRETSSQVTAAQRAQLAEAYRAAAAMAGCPVVVAEEVVASLSDSERHADQLDVHLSAQANDMLAAAIADAIGRVGWLSR